jgi:hypothetical protein
MSRSLFLGRCRMRPITCSCLRLPRGHQVSHFCLQSLDSIGIMHAILLQTPDTAKEDVKVSGNVFEFFERVLQVRDLLVKLDLFLSNSFVLLDETFEAGNFLLSPLIKGPVLLVRLNGRDLLLDAPNYRCGGLSSFSNSFSGLNASVVDNMSFAQKECCVDSTFLCPSAKLRQPRKAFAEHLL